MLADVVTGVEACALPLYPAGNPVPSFTGTVTVVLGNNPGGSTLGGTDRKSVVEGNAVVGGRRRGRTSTSYKPRGTEPRHDTTPRTGCTPTPSTAPATPLS